MAFVYIIAGLILLLIGAEFLVRGSVALAERLKISPLVVGLTVVAFGTSAPELVVSIGAALSGASGLSVGNVVGSNIANILLILGITSMIWPITCNRKEFIRDFSSLFIISLIFVAFILTKKLVLWNGIVMVIMLLGFIYLSYKRESKGQDNAEQHIQEVEELETFKNKPWGTVIIAVLSGLAGVIFGAHLLVEGAVDLAMAMGVSEEVIGLTLVAFGTSVPELATSAMAAFKKQPGMALGNVLGSNIWNILCIMGITSTIIDIPVPVQVLNFDIWVMSAATLLLLPFMLSQNTLTRIEGAIFFIIYCSYIAAQYYVSQNGGVLF